MSGAGRNGKNRLLSQKCQQAGSVCKQETRSYWWKKAPHQPITKLHGKPRDLVAEEGGKLREGVVCLVCSVVVFFLCCESKQGGGS